MTNDIIKDIKNNNTKRSEFIENHKNFILATASKILGRYVGEDEDVYSVALIAFDEAITKYQPDKGSFTSFAALIIRSRLIDEYRKSDKNTLPFSSLERENSDGEKEAFDIDGRTEIMSDTVIELEALKTELKKYNISVLDIPDDSPKSRKTKLAVAGILDFITGSEAAQSLLIKNKEIPSKLIADSIGVKVKLMERHRKYIIAASVILIGDYPIISQYIKKLWEVAK